ncbi:hypothetical protein B9Z55_015584 [Caenorhabditis nigoni]|uniref:Uncharacterized protein n=1 Tax=Caenorhabditis nigoni TaxID=1611254 RepID=A0A2G5UB54_9PELO|nr:hypothetical protein B9Z55_015584 [Caenorhabditis nigoni]
MTLIKNEGLKFLELNGKVLGYHHSPPQVNPTRLHENQYQRQCSNGGPIAGGDTVEMIIKCRFLKLKNEAV